MLEKQLTNLVSLGTLAVLALCLSVGATPKTMTKSYTIRGHVEGTFTGPTTYHFVDIGITSHAGRHYNEGDIDLADGTGSGIWTAANGDTTTWTSTMDSSGGVHVVTTGGTGRYSGATGGFDGHIVGAPIIDPIAGTITYDYVGTGETTY